MGSSELDRLKSEEEAAFHRKQEAYKQYQKARSQTDAVYQEQQAAWDKVTNARKEMNQAYEELQYTHRNNDNIWNEYKRIRDNNNSQINYLKAQVDSLYSSMVSAFGCASDAYNYGNKSDAKIYSNEGKDYQAQLKHVNAQINRLGQEVKDARVHAELCSSRADPSRLNSAKNEFECAKSAHKSIEAKFKSAKAERERLHSEFKALNEAYKRKASAFHSALSNKKAEQKIRQQNHKDLMEKAGIPYRYWKDCKVMKGADGTINFYFGGLMQKDGLWHGHIVMDSSGKITYKRMPGEEHGKQNYTDVPLKNGIYDGTFDGYPAIIKVSDAGNSNQVQIFYGGEGSPDGPGHNHINVTKDKLQFWRENGKTIYQDDKNIQINNF